jgi:hypothetical protein
MWTHSRFGFYGVRSRPGSRGHPPALVEVPWSAIQRVVLLKNRSRDCLRPSRQPPDGQVAILVLAAGKNEVPVESSGALDDPFSM